jgi:hypothetical protein
MCLFGAGRSLANPLPFAAMSDGAPAPVDRTLVSHVFDGQTRLSGPTQEFNAGDLAR